ncbi:hypothetical protein [Acetobacter persici]|uniref:hypothetical protein n=1 Tax=Acetobacter persici TaxID=1076596 RepID=UPI001BA6C31F|nr:hypothetical protein [Acetobacter persici]MBS1015397.1 hypothetical protein [Acetobacter persici]
MIKNRKITNTFAQEADTQVALAHIASDPRYKYLYDRLYLDSTNQRYYTILSVETNKFYNQIPFNHLSTYLAEIDQNAVYDKQSDSIILNKGTSSEFSITDDVIKDFVNGCYTRIYKTKSDIPFYNRYYVNNGDLTLNTWAWNGIDYDDQVNSAASKPFFDWLYFLLAGGLNDPEHEMGMADYRRIINSDWAGLKTNSERQFYTICHWIADAYQQPLKSGDTALLLTGGQNIGKSSLVPLIGRIIDKGFGRAMEAKVFLSPYDDDFVRPSIIDISDTHEVPAYKFEEQLRQRIRPSAATRLFNMKGNAKIQGRCHNRFVASSNNADFVSMKKGETTRYHLIDCASITSISQNKQKYESIIEAMKSIISTEEFDNDTFAADQQEYLSAISMMLDNIEVDNKLCQSSSGYETDLMIKMINENSSTLKMLLIEKYKVLHGLKSQRMDDFTKIISVTEMYKKLVEDDKVTEKQVSPAAFKKMISDQRNSEYANYDSSKGRVSLKIIPPEADDEQDDQNKRDNVYAMERLKGKK